MDRLMESVEAESGLHMSYEDLMGMGTGPHKDVPAMLLLLKHEIHICSACLFAKSTESGKTDCIRNKLAVNRVVMHKMSSHEGFCHMGLFDLAEPLIYQGVLLGIFYYGSVRVRGREQITEQRLFKYCRRWNLDPEPFLREFQNRPAITPDSIPRHRATLQTIVRLAHHFFEMAGITPEHYKARSLTFPYLDPTILPWLLVEADHYISANLDRPFNIKDIATHLNCNPDFLGRKFKQHTGLELNTYITEARIDRAKKLMENPSFDIEDAAIQAGFSDRVYFSKAFRRLTGLTPGEYRRRLAAGKSEA